MKKTKETKCLGVTGAGKSASVAMLFSIALTIATGVSQAEPTKKWDMEIKPRDPSKERANPTPVPVVAPTPIQPVIKSVRGLSTKEGWNEAPPETNAPTDSLSAAVKRDPNWSNVGYLQKQVTELEARVKALESKK
jgi:hypothetical protein